LPGNVRDLQKWLATAMPGAEKEAARKKMLKQAEAEGLRLGKENGQNVWYTTGKAGGLRGNPSSKLLEMQKEYEDLPGFAEGVANAVAEGMKDVANSIGTNVGNAIKDWAPQINLPEIKIPDISIPGMDTLAKAMKTLNEMLGKFIQDPLEYMKNYAFGETNETQANSEVKEDQQKQNTSGTSGYASGATFLSGGIFKGEVHPTEEIIPQAITQRGAGPISRMLAMINEANPSFDPGQGKQRDAVYAPTNINIHIDRIEKDVDVDKLLFRIRDELDSHATRTIGYLRG
jgi:hypothetical protein